MFNERLKEAMDARGMTAADLCRLTDIPKNSLSNYISGKMEPKSRRIYELAHALNVQEAWLLGYDVSMDRPRDDAAIKDEIRKMLDLLDPNEQEAILATIQAFVDKNKGS